MKTQRILSTRLALFLSPLGLLVALAATGACDGEFKTRCSDGSEPNGDGPDACPAAAAGSAGGVQGGGSAGAAGVAAGAAGAAGEAGSAAGGGASGTGGSAGGGITIEQVSISAGSAQACVSTPSSTQCWGSRGSGVLAGFPAGSGPQPEPVTIENGALGVVRQIELGAGYGCAVRDDGRVLCWGENGNGQLGLGAGAVSSDDRPIPALLDNTNLGTVRQIACGDRHTCAVRDDGKVFCWGSSSSGRLGFTGVIGMDFPSPVLLEDGALGVVRQVALGDEHSCALREDGRVLCWGGNGAGQLGNGTTSGYDPNPIPALVDNSELGVVRQIALGRFHTCALRDDGKVFCWGLNQFGQVGVAATATIEGYEPSPKLVEDGPLGIVDSLALGPEHSCAVRTDGRVLCWGNNFKGQLGVATNVGTLLPTPVPSLLDGSALGVVHRIEAGRYHTCALRDDGRVLCWGSNTYGQLGSNTGLGTDGPNAVPALVEGLPSLTR